MFICLSLEYLFFNVIDSLDVIIEYVYILFVVLMTLFLFHIVYLLFQLFLFLYDSCLLTNILDPIQICSLAIEVHDLIFIQTAIGP